MINTKKQWAMPQLTIHGDVEQLTQQVAMKKCPGGQDSLAVGIRDTNLPVGAPCSS